MTVSSLLLRLISHVASKRAGFNRSPMSEKMSLLRLLCDASDTFHAPSLMKNFHCTPFPSFGWSDLLDDEKGNAVCDIIACRVSLTLRRIGGREHSGLQKKDEKSSASPVGPYHLASAVGKGVGVGQSKEKK